ncbi:MAG: ParB/RepB/Spo0J family partition protein [Anaerolineae bacterium]
MTTFRRAGLGKGLDALIPQSADSSGLRRVSVDAIVPNPMQPRSVFDPEALQELADSIRELGLIQPLIVQRVQDADVARPARYQLITGERRWRAAQLAGLRHVDVVVKDATPQEMLELALVENIQRADLNPLEEAQAYAQLVESFGLTQEQVAARVGRSRVSVTNTMRLLRLPSDVRELLITGKLTEGHARSLLMLEQGQEQSAVAREIVQKGLSVRQAEELVRRRQAVSEDALEPAAPRQRSPETEALEQDFREAMGTRVELFRSKKGGRLVIHFYSEEDLQDLYERLVEQER